MKNLNDLDIQLLSDFENGTLSKDQANEVKSRLERDSTFHKLNEDLKTIGSLLKDHYSTTSKNSPSPVLAYLKNLEKSLPPVEPVKEPFTAITPKEEKGKIVFLSKTNHILLVAACITLLIAIGFFLKYKHDDDTSPQISEELFKPYPNIVNPQKMGTEDNKANELTTGYSYYESKKYSEAAQLFEKFLEKKEDPYVLFYTANCYYAMKQNNRAIEKFNQLLVNYTDFYLESPARWLLSLCYLNEGNPEKAKKELGKLKNDYYKEQATKLLLKFQN